MKSLEKLLIQEFDMTKKQVNSVLSDTTLMLIFIYNAYQWLCQHSAKSVCCKIFIWHTEMASFSARTHQRMNFLRGLGVTGMLK